MTRRTAPVLLSLMAVLALGLAACGSSKQASPSANAGNRPSTQATLPIVAPAANAGGRPSSQARLAIAAPAANAVVGPNVTVEMKPPGGEVGRPSQTSGPLTGDKGQIHASVDGQLVSMNYSTTAQINSLKPG